MVQRQLTFSSFLAYPARQDFVSLIGTDSQLAQTDLQCGPHALTVISSILLHQAFAKGYPMLSNVIGTIEEMVESTVDQESFDTVIGDTIDRLRDKNYVAMATNDENFWIYLTPLGIRQLDSILIHEQ